MASHLAGLGPLSGWCAGGVYVRSPFAGSYHEAELQCVPIGRAEEYAHVAEFEHRGEAPVLMSLSERNTMLADIVRDLRTHVPDLSCVLIRTYGPDFNVQLPAGLLSADVVLVHWPADALPIVLASGRRNVAVIHHDLRADGIERGRNALSVALLAPSEPGSGLAAFSRFVAECSFMQRLDGLRMHSLCEASAV
ncbi:hypothetical protein QTH90_24160 [Variovorax sp. J2P1-59]|uniref:hypothetical protein n=1 Tax=Variovorax flavidus TaxID=3053501 RepID=UPI0025782EBC|nr:hypothetical protein [Variovorax sp. J2P1-59]MDM0077522.1 hypothetical protein [Variovorax sp. J2P1-59]